MARRRGFLQGVRALLEALAPNVRFLWKRALTPYVLSLAMTVAMHAQVRPEPPGAPTFVGILGSQGVVVPFAQFDGRTWTNGGAGPWDIDDKTWPRPWFAPWFDVGRQHLRDWSVRLFEADVVSPAELQRPERVVHTANYTAIVSGCEYVWALSSDAPVFERSSDGGGWPVGFAMTGTHAIAGFARLADGDPDVLRITTFVSARFDALEDARVANPPYPPSRPYPIASIRHATTPFELTVLRSDALPDGQRLFQLRAERKYERTPGNLNDTQYTVFNLWVAADRAAQLRMIAEDVTLGEGEARNYDNRSALGLFVLGSRTFVPIIQSGYEGGVYAILEFTGGAMRRLIQMESGGC